MDCYCIITHVHFHILMSIFDNAVMHNQHNKNLHSLPLFVWRIREIPFPFPRDSNTILCKVMIIQSKANRTSTLLAQIFS